MNGNRYVATFLGVAAVVTGVIALIALNYGDVRVGTAIIGQTTELGWVTAIVAVALVVLGIGAFVAPYRPLYAAGLFAVGVIGLLVAQWADISQFAVDLWTSATGGVVAYVDSQGLAHMPDVWAILGGSVTMLGYVGTVIFGTAAAIVAAFTPETEAAPELRPAMRPTTA